MEVVNSPGARYDAQASAVVRIRTLRRIGEGWGFTVDSRDAKGFACGNNQWYSTLNINYHHKSFDFFGSVSYQDDYLDGYSTEVTQHSYAQSLQDKSQVIDYGKAGSTELKWRYGQVNFNLGVDWQIADNHSAGFKVERSSNVKSIKNFNMKDAISRNGLMIDELLSNTHTDTDYSNSWFANVYYLGKVGRWRIDWNVDYYHGSDAATAYTIEKSRMKNRNVFSYNAVSNNLLATKVVFSRPLWKGSLSIGTELTFVNRKSDYDITEENIRNSRNKVEENAYAAFVEYSRNFFNIGRLGFGARYEHVDFAYDDPLSFSCLSRHLNHIYPYLSLGGQNGEVQGSLSYSVKTRRPDYRCLRSNVEYNNRFTLSTGNPTLSNEIRHEVGANVRWRWLGVSVNYAYIKDGIYDWTYPYDDKGTLLLSWVNLDSPLRQFSAFVNASPSVGCWQPNYTIGLQKQWLSYELDDPCTVTGKRNVGNDRPIFFCNANNSFRLPTRKDGKVSWQLELNSELMGGGHWGNAEITNWSWNLSCAVQKAFLGDDALTVRLVVTDVFHKTYNNVRIDLGNYVMTRSHILGVERESYDFRRIILSVRYKLNASKSKYKGKGAGTEMLNRM